VPPTNSTPTAPDGYPCGPSTSCAHEPTRAISQTVNLIRAQFRTPSVAMRSSADRRLGEKSTSPRRLDSAESRTLESLYRWRREFWWLVGAGLFAKRGRERRRASSVCLGILSVVLASWRRFRRR
jgi:hypothetical protein